MTPRWPGWLAVLAGIALILAILIMLGHQVRVG